MPQLHAERADVAYMAERAYAAAAEPRDKAIPLQAIDSTLLPQVSSHGVKAVIEDT